MIYALKLLFFVLVTATATAMVLRPAFASLFTPVQYKRAWTWLIVVTVIAFMSMRAEVFFLLLAVACLFAPRYLGSGDDGKVNAFMLFLLPLPPITYVVGGLDGLNYVLRFDHARTLVLVLLTVPAARLLLRQRKRDEPSLRAIDIAIVLYQLWGILLIGRYASLTGLCRTLFTSFVDVLIPYYVLTRTLRTAEQLRQAASYLLLGCVFVASVGCAESLVQRNLYGGLQWIYGVRWESTVDLMRGGFLRVESTTPQPIILAFVVTFGAGLWTWLKGGAPRDKWVYAGYFIFGFALLSTWSRGPWLGAGLLVLALLLQRWLPPRAFGVVVLLGLVAGVLAKALGADSAVMSALALLFGSAGDDLSTITYRRDLLDASLAMIKQSPWMGVPNYETALESFRQGEGMIDLVNTYIVIMINSGAIGLALFLFPYAYTIGRMLGIQGRSATELKGAMGKFAPAFIAIALALLFIIFTASTLDVMGWLLGLAISLPAAWLMQAKESARSSKSLSPRAGLDTSSGQAPAYVDDPGLFRR